MGEVVVLHKKILDEAHALNECWSAYQSINENDPGPQDTEWEFGGYNATLAACGLPPDAGDFDFFLRNPQNKQKNIEAYRIKIGSYMHSQLCRHYSKNPYLIKKNTDLRSFFNFKIDNNDYTIGSRKIYSNFQVSIDLKTFEVKFDPSIPTHEADFEKFKTSGEIITYRFNDLIENAKNTQEGFTALSWVLKSYIKPLKSGKHFSIETAESLLSLKKNHYDLYANLKQDCMNYYGIHELDFDLIFDAALENRIMHCQNKIADDLKKTNEQAFKAATSSIAEKSDQIESLQKKYESSQKENARLSIILGHQKDEIKKLETENKSLEETSKKQQGKMQASAKKQNEQTKQIADLNEEMSKQKQEMTQLGNKNTKLAQEVESNLEAVKEKEKQLDSMTEKLKEEQEKNKSLQKEDKAQVSQFKLQENAIKMAIFMKNRVFESDAPCVFNDDVYQALDTLYKKTIQDTDNLESINLQIAAATLAHARANPSLFIDIFNTVLEFKPNERLNGSLHLFQLVTQIDLACNKHFKGTVGAPERLRQVTLAVYAINQYINTRYFQEGKDAFAVLSLQYSRGLALRLSSADEISTQLQSVCLQAQLFVDAFLGVLDANSKQIIDFIRQNKNKTKKISPQLVAMLEKIFTLKFESLDREFKTQLLDDALSVFLLKHSISESDFQILINCYHQAKREQDIALTQSVFISLHTQHLKIPKRATKLEKKIKEGLSNRREFVKAYFEAVHHRFPDNDIEFLLRTYLTHLKDLYLQNSPSGSWMGHPLVEALSLVFAHKNEGDLKNPRYQGTLLSNAQAQLVASPIIPPALLTSEKMLLAVMIGVFLSFLPKDNLAIISSYQDLLRYLINPNSLPSATMASLQYLRGTPMVNQSDIPLNQQAASAKLFISEYLGAESAKLDLITDIEWVQLGQHIAEFSDEIIKNVAALIKEASESGSFTRPSTACAFYGAVLGGDLQKTYFAPIVKWSKFFKDKAIWGKLGLICHSQISNELVPLSIRLSIVYPELIKSQNILAILYTNIDQTSDISRTQNYEHMVGLFTRLPRVPSIEDLYDLLCYVAFELPATKMQGTLAGERMKRLADQLHASLKATSDIQVDPQHKRTVSQGLQG